MILGDLQNLLGEIVVLLILLILIFWPIGHVLKWQSPVFTGRKGEWLVSKALLSLDPDKYKVFNDLLFPSSGNISTTQIDHIVVSNFGIFVIETKNLSGWIFGDAYQREWTQVIYYYKNKFYNPLYQNYAHKKAIETLVKPFFPNIPVIGFVAFPSADKVKVLKTNAVGLPEHIVSKILSYTKEFVSESEREDIIHILAAYDIQDKDLHRQHVQNARAQKSLRESGLGH